MWLSRRMGWLTVLAAALLGGCGGSGERTVPLQDLTEPADRTYRLTGLTGLGFNEAVADVTVERLQYPLTVGDSIRLGLASLDPRLDGVAAAADAVAPDRIEGSLQPAVSPEETRWQFSLALTEQGNRALLTLSDGATNVTGVGRLTTAGDLSMAALARIGREAGVVVSTSEVLGLLLPVAAGQGSFPGTDNTVVYGSCPQTTATRTGNDISILFDYGTGCVSSYSARKLISGRAAVAANDQGQGRGTMTLDNLVLGGEPVVGQMTATFPGRSARQAAIPMGIGMALTYGQFGRLEGQFDLQFGSTGFFAVNQGQFTNTGPSGEAVRFQTNGMAINPVAEQSYVPQQGVVVITMPHPDRAGQELAAEVVFRLSSPTSELVDLQWQGETLALPLDLPGGAD